MIKIIYLLIVILCPFIVCTQTSVDAVLESYKKDKDLTHAQYSFCVLEAASGKILKEYNSELAMIPASTLKVMTTSTALGILGKDFVYKTKFYTSQKTDSTTGICNGSLLVKGSGDPSFNSSYFYASDSLFFNPFIKTLLLKRIKKINNPVMVDVSCFDNTIPETWIWGDIGNYFGAGANGLSYKDNKFSLFYNSDGANTKATIVSIKPSYFSDKMVIQSSVKIGGTEDNAFVFGDPDSYTRRVSGTIPANKKNYEVEAQMPEPPLFFANALITELKKNAITINESKPLILQEVQPNTTDNLQLIYTHVSPKLQKIVYYTNTKSNNHYAESLLKTIGAFKTGRYGTTDNGIDVVKNYWRDRGVDVSGLHMVDGSGLSRANTITTKIQATVLSKIYRDSAMYYSFNTSLPIAGKSGSMINLCKGTFAENNMRAKTGYINRARGYCGYVKTKSGKELAFSILFNNYNCSASEAKQKIEKFLVALVEL